MWNKNRKEIDEYDEIIKFINDNENFHDMRIGGFSYNSKERTAGICIEMVDNRKDISDDVEYQYVLQFSEIEQMEFDVDLAISTYIYECYEEEKNEIVLGLTNGHISFKANKIALDVPSNEK